VKRREAGQAHQSIGIPVYSLNHIIVIQLEIFGIFPGKTKHQRFLNTCFVHCRNQVSRPHQPGLGRIVKGFKGLLAVKKNFPVLPDAGREDVGMEINDHYKFLRF